LVGGAAGVLFGLASGYALAKSAIAEKLVAPYLVASQSVPVVAFTPGTEAIFAGRFCRAAMPGAASSPSWRPRSASPASAR